MVEWFVKAVPENPTSRRKLLLSAGAGVAAVAVIGALWSNSTSGSGEVALDARADAVVNSQSSGTLFVQVVGAVVNPGVYEVPIDSRVMDAVALAGGLSPRADPASLNLARIVQDGEQIIVGAAGDAQSRRTASSLSGKVNINTATAEDLDTLPRIGVTLAERIIAYRDEHGPFAGIESLLEVPGIGDLTLAGMRDKITL
ncbi:MAG: ComEA family DNA-binding protein [Microbacteriaceae bacterium]|jgi:competence protein ComEA|nr:ComEA family DNA-binding protein [Microbacteriaceae bacterium]